MVNLIFFFAASLISLSYFFYDILILRLLTILGCLVYLLGGVLAGYTAEGMPVIIAFSVINATTNLVQSFLIIRDKKPIVLPEQLKKIYTVSFYILMPRVFLKIYNLAYSKKAKKGDILATDGQYIPDLYLITEGLANIIKNNQVVTTIGAGFFVGEMSFITHGVANATVQTVSDEIDYLVWSKEKLAKLELTDAPLFNNIKQVIALNLIKKIERQPHHKGDVNEVAC